MTLVKAPLCLVVCAQLACVVDWDGYEPVGHGAAGGGGAGSQTGGGGNTGGSVNSDGCGRIGLLHDDFEDGLDSDELLLEASGNGYIAESAGRMQLLASSLSDDVRVVSGWGWDLREGFVSVEVPKVPALGETILKLTQASKSQGGSFSVLVSAGQIYAEANGVLVGAKTGYSVSEHRFWKIGESQDMIYFQTSPDGSAWNDLASKPVSELFPVDIVYLTLQRVGDDGETAEFDNVEGGPTTDKGWCAPSRFADDFNDGELENYWEQVTSNGGTVIEEGGTVVATAVSGDSQRLESAQPVDMLGAAISVELVDVVIPNSNVYVFFRAGESDRNVKFLLSQTHIAPTFDDGTNVDQCNAVERASFTDHWLQIREEAGTIYWETSADGMNWKHFCDKTTPAWWDPSQVSAIAVGVSGQDGSVAFDNVNAP